jgi:hypothetical protein
MMQGMRERVVDAFTALTTRTLAIQLDRGPEPGASARLPGAACADALLSRWGSPEQFRRSRRVPS